jgi:hypothetical protein
LIEPERERVDLALELTEAARKAIALLPERLRERHHGLDQSVLTVGVEWGIVHAPLPLGPALAPERARRMPPRLGPFDAHLASVHVADLTA